MGGGVQHPVFGGASNNNSFLSERSSIQMAEKSGMKRSKSSSGISNPTNVSNVSG
jgi:hypothetical protein